MMMIGSQGDMMLTVRTIAQVMMHLSIGLCLVLRNFQAEEMITRAIVSRVMIDFLVMTIEQSIGLAQVALMMGEVSDLESGHHAPIEGSEVMIIHHLVIVLGMKHQRSPPKCLKTVLWVLIEERDPHTGWLK